MATVEAQIDGKVLVVMEVHHVETLHSLGAPAGDEAQAAGGFRRLELVQLVNRLSRQIRFGRGMEESGALATSASPREGDEVVRLRNGDGVEATLCLALASLLTTGVATTTLRTELPASRPASGGQTLLQAWVVRKDQNDGRTHRRGAVKIAAFVSATSQRAETMTATTVADVQIDHVLSKIDMAAPTATKRIAWPVMESFWDANGEALKR